MQVGPAPACLVGYIPLTLSLWYFVTAAVTKVDKQSFLGVAYIVHL